MVKEIRARFSRGKVEPLGEVELREGEEILITVKKVLSETAAKDAFQRAAGGWKGTLDFDAYL